MAGDHPSGRRRRPELAEGAPRAADADPATDGDALSALLVELASAPARDPAELAPPLEPGTAVGRFELLREIGRGGFGIVFEARDRELGRLVAFKAMRARGALLEQPLREEAEAAARLNHPNIVTLHDYGLHGGTPYLILELLRGETLQARLRAGPLEAREAVRIAMEVAGGLVHAHAAGVVHRDLKPGNVFVTERGGVKILDFGLASLLGRASLAGGTPAYMAPEQLRGEPGDARADVFSAAVVLFQMLSGALPFPVTDGRSAALEPGPSPRLPLADAPPELAALLASALSKDPADRPQGAQALLEALQAVARAYDRAAAERSRADRRRRARRAIFVAGTAALAAASGVAALALRASVQAERALRASRIASAAEGASDPLVATLLMTELGDDPPPRAVELAQRLLREAIPGVVLEGARGGFALAVSPDGARVAAGLRGAIGIWRVDGTGAARFVPAGDARQNAVAFTPDGTRVVAAGHDGAVRVFQTERGATPTLVHAGEAPFVRLRVSPDGRLAAAAALDGRAWIVPLDGTGDVRAVVHDGAVFDVAFSPDSRRLLTASADGTVLLSDVRSGAPVSTWAIDGGAVFAAAFSPDGRTVLTASEDGTARLFPTEADASPAPLARTAARGPRAAAVLRDGADPVGFATFSADGARVLVGSRDGTARVYVVDRPGEPVRLRGSGGPLWGAAFSPDGARVLTWAADGIARLWRSDGEGAPVALRGHPVVGAVFTPDGARVLTRGRDGTIRVWSADDPAERGVLRGHEGLVDTVEWSRDGSRLLTASHDGTARIWPLRGGGPPLVLRDPGGILHSAQLDPRERTILTASQDGTVRLWRAGDGALLRELRGHEGAALFAAFSPDGSRIASGSLDRTVRVWRADGAGEPIVLRGHDGAITHVGWTPDGRTVVSASQLDATVRLWPADGGEARVIRAERGVFRADASPDGARILVAQEDGPARLFRLDTLSELPPIPGWPDALFAARWSADGSRVALTSADGTVRVVSPDRVEDPLVLRGHRAAVGHAAFSPAGDELATAGGDGTARIWAIGWGRILAQLRAATTACLPASHRVQLLGETPAEAQRRTAACHRAHGRLPPEAPVAPAGEPSARAERAQGGAKG